MYYLTHNLKSVIIVCAVLTSIFESCQPREEEVYLYTAYSESGLSGLQYLYSEDGMRWDSVPGTFLIPHFATDTSYIDAFTGKEKSCGCKPGNMMRDPSIAQGPDDTYHLVWTAQWYGVRGFGYSSSTDLKNWSEPRLINVMLNHPTNNVWAPEIFYDEVQGQFLIIWASQIDPNTLTEQDQLGKNKSHRLWYCITKDFKTFTDAMPYYDPGYNSNDAYLVKRGRNDYVLLLKDNRKPGFSNIYCAYSDSPYGPFTNPCTPFTPSYCGSASAIPLDGGWLIYYWQYKPEQQTCAAFTPDFESFTPASDRINVPTDMKTGTPLRIKRSLLNSLLFDNKTQTEKK